MPKFNVVFQREPEIEFKGHRLKVNTIEKLVIAETRKEVYEFYVGKAFKGFYLYGIEELEPFS